MTDGEDDPLYRELREGYQGWSSDGASALWEIFAAVFVIFPLWVISGIVRAIRGR